MAVGDLYEHEFTKAVLEHSRESAVATMVATLKDDSPPPLRDEYDYYTRRVLVNVVALLSEVQRVAQCIAFLSCYRATNAATNAGITKADFVEAGVEHIIIRTQVLYDRALCLVDAVFDLTNDVSLINHALIVGNGRIRSTKTASALRSLRKVIMKYNTPRNELIHRGGWNDGELRYLQTATILLNTAPSEVLASSVPLRNLRRERNRLGKAIVRARKGEFGEFVECVSNAARSLFDALLGQYRVRVTRFAMECGREVSWPSP